MDHILDPSLTIAWKVAIGVEKPANEIRETIRLDQRYLFDHAKTTLASRIDQLDKGTAPKDVNWGMEAVVAGSMYKGINVEKRVETLYNLSVQKGQLTSVQQKELGDTHDLTSSNFIVHASTMGSMSMEKAEFQKGLERTAEGQTYLGYTLINAAVGRMAQYNLDAGVGISNYDDPANSRFKIESKGGVAAGDVAIGSTTGNAAVASVAPHAITTAAKPSASVKVEGKPMVEGRGLSGGGHQPISLTEQLATEVAMADPNAGKKLFNSNDLRWPQSEGWGKYTQNINGVEVHYQYSPLTGQIDDFKIK